MRTWASRLPTELLEKKSALIDFVRKAFDIDKIVFKTEKNERKYIDAQFFFSRTYIPFLYENAKSGTAAETVPTPN